MSAIDERNAAVDFERSGSPDSLKRKRSEDDREGSTRRKVTYLEEHQDIHVIRGSPFVQFPCSRPFCGLLIFCPGLGVLAAQDFGRYIEPWAQGMGTMTFGGGIASDCFLTHKADMSIINVFEEVFRDAGNTTEFFYRQLDTIREKVELCDVLYADMKPGYRVDITVPLRWIGTPAGFEEFVAKLNSLCAEYIKSRNHPKDSPFSYGRFRNFRIIPTDIALQSGKPSDDPLFDPKEAYIPIHVQGETIELYRGYPMRSALFPHILC
jgi:hypothetical protein